MPPGRHQVHSDLRTRCGRTAASWVAGSRASTIPFFGITFYGPTPEQLRRRPVAPSRRAPSSLPPSTSRSSTTSSAATHPRGHSNVLAMANSLAAYALNCTAMFRPTRSVEATDIIDQGQYGDTHYYMIPRRHASDTHAARDGRRARRRSLALPDAVLRVWIEDAYCATRVPANTCSSRSSRSAIRSLWSATCSAPSRSASTTPSTGFRRRYPAARNADGRPVRRRRPCPDEPTHRTTDNDSLGFPQLTVVAGHSRPRPSDNQAGQGQGGPSNRQSTRHARGERDSEGHQAAIRSRICADLFTSVPKPAVRNPARRRGAAEADRQRAHWAEGQGHRNQQGSARQKDAA